MGIHRRRLSTRAAAAWISRMWCVSLRYSLFLSRSYSWRFISLCLFSLSLSHFWDLSLHSHIPPRVKFHVDLCLCLFNLIRTNGLYFCFLSLYLSGFAGSFHPSLTHFPPPLDLPCTSLYPPDRSTATPCCLPHIHSPHSSYLSHALSPQPRPHHTQQSNEQLD